MVFSLFNNHHIGALINKSYKPILKNASKGLFSNIENKKFSNFLSNSLLKLGYKYAASYLRNAKEDLILNSFKEYDVKTATYLKDIPQIFGKMLMLGNIIWSTCISIQEHHKIIQQNKSNSINENPKKYSLYKESMYKASFAVSVCIGPVDKILKIYFNEEEIDERLYNIRIYTGKETQMPDPLIEKHLGVGKTPAFRDLCYIVVEDLDIAMFHYKLPHVKCLISKGEDIISKNFSPLIKQIGDFIQCKSEIIPEHSIAGVLFNRNTFLYEIFEHLNLHIILKDNSIECFQEHDVPVRKINDNFIIPIDGISCLQQNMSEIVKNNVCINYLNAQNFKAKSYLNQVSSSQKLETISMPFAIEDSEAAKFYKNYKSNLLKRSCFFIFQIVATDLIINVGEFIEITLEKRKIKLKVLKKRYHNNNVITLFCCKGI